MMYKMFLHSFIVLTFGNLQASIPATPNLFDINTLHKHEEINCYLRSEGFTQHWITTEDMYELDALFLHRPAARFTIIICNGLCCVKESMSTFYHLLPADCNILFFDARGHGKSSGSLATAPWQYGIHEYKDILAALAFVRSRAKKPVILYGSCAGGFNAAHALVYLTQQQELQTSGVCGFIYDSGWGSRMETFTTAGRAKIDKVARKMALKYLSRTWQKYCANTTLVRLAKLISNQIITLINTYVAVPLLIHTEAENNLYKKIGLLDIPIFFIHSVDDTWVPFVNAQALARSAQKPSTWWITAPSLHSCHHLVHTETYRQKVTDFCCSLFK